MSPEGQTIEQILYHGIGIMERYQVYQAKYQSTMNSSYLITIMNTTIDIDQ